MTKKKSKKVDENERLINQIPDDIVLSSILSYFTIKELARIRLVSRHWNRICHHISMLNFENSSSKQKIRNQDHANINQHPAKHCRDDELIEQETSSYVNWVNHVVSKHLGSTIHLFKLSFELNSTYQSHIDKWVLWAFSKHVQNLELDFTRVSVFLELGSENNRYLLDESLLNKVKVKPVLTCLCLKSVNVTTQGVEHLLEICCSTLENLCIEKSHYLTCIRVRNSVEMKSLKYLKVFACDNLEVIDISAPNLVCFTYELGSRLGLRLLRIANALSLSRVLIFMERVDCLVNALNSLSNCILQLECLKLRWYLTPSMDLVFNSPPDLANLKHLELCVNGYADRTLAGWIPLIKACPRLKKLTLRLQCLRSSKDLVVVCDKHPLLYLKTLEIIGYVGCNVDLDVANFVLENGVSLQEVILDPTQSVHQPGKSDVKVLSTKGLKIRRGVKLIII